MIPRSVPAAALLALLLGLGAEAQVPPAAEPSPAPSTLGEEGAAEGSTLRRVFTIRWADTSDVYHVLSEEMGIDLITVLPSSKQVIVEARPEVLGRIEEWLRQLDVPPNAAVVRIILERAERPAAGGAGELPLEPHSWTRRVLAETTLEVLERREVTQTFGPDGVFEIRVALGSVDLERKLMHLDRFAISRIQEAPAGEPPFAEDDPRRRRELLRTSLDLQDRVGRTIMSASSEGSEVALVVRTVGLIRPAAWEGP